jgi:hypothetical protein
MASLTIRIENHKQKFTVSEMRIRLAQVLSKLNGDQEVSFTFVAQLDDYKPARRSAFYPQHASTHSVTAELREGENVVHGEFARPEND